MTARTPDSAGLPSRAVVPCVGAVVKDGQDRLLLIKRGHDPGIGLWSLPGGRVEPGETDAQAVQREVLEETGLTVSCGRLVGAVRRPGPAGSVFDIRDYAAALTGGTLRPGDDAADAAWASPAEIASLDDGGLLTDGLLGSLRSWGVLPALP